MYLGTAETGKTRAAYEWVCEILKDTSNAEILIPKGGGFPNPIKEDCVPKLAETVVMFYDDMHTFMLPKGQAQRRSEERVLSPEDRFEDLIEVLESCCTRLYIVCTARWERAVAVQPVESYRDVWKTFHILTLKDAPKEEETGMIEELAGYHGIQLADEMAEQMADTNRGRSYENTVEFLQKRKGRSLGEQDLEEYAKGTSRRWESQLFHELQLQNALVAQLVGAMYTLRFELGLPLYQRFVLRAAAIRTGGLFRKRRLRSALNLLCKRGGFHVEEDMILCHDFQLEIPARVSPPVEECLKRLYRRKRFLSDSVPLTLAEWHFYRGLEFGEQGELEAAAGEYEKSISLEEASSTTYYNWGVALYDLASLRQNKGLLQESIEKYRRAVELEPDLHGAYYNWGVALSDLATLRQDEGLLQESIEKYKRAVELKPDFDAAYNNWGLAMCDLARFRQDERFLQEGIEKYKRAVEIKPDKHEAYGNWGNALYELARLRQDEGLLQESFEKHECALDLKPDDPKAYYNWGVALYELARLRNDEGLFQESIEKYKRAVELKPDYDIVYNNWGSALSHLARLGQDEGLFQESIEKFKRSLEINPGSWRAYFNMAGSYAQLRLVKEACEALDSAFSLFPDVVDKVRTVLAFDPIRDDPMFRQWLREHEGRKT